MKLHLPKQLFTALLAAITLAAPAALTLGSAAWANSGLYNGSSFLFGGTGAGGTNQNPYTHITEATPTGGKLTTTVDKIDASSLSEFNIWADSGSNVWTNALVKEWLVGNNATIKVSESAWKHEGNTRYFDSLHIQNLNIDGGEAALNITLAAHIVTVDAVNGSLSSVNNAGTLTLGAVTLSGDVTNSGTLTLGPATLSGNVTNSGTLTLGPATLSGDVTNSGTLIIAGTLSGTGTLTNNDNGKVKVDTTNFCAFDGLKYTTADGETNNVKAGFLIGEQKLQVLGEGVTYTGEVYINDSETGTTLTNGAVTMTIGAVANTFYVNDDWTYDAVVSNGATAFYVASAGTLHLDELEAVDGVISAVPAPIQNSGNVSIAAGTNGVTLNDLFGTTAITQDSTGTTSITGSGAVSMDAALSVSGTIIIDGTGSLTNSGQTLTLDKLVLQGGTSATVTGSAAIITGDVVVGDDSILTLGSTVGGKGLVKGLITVKDGGKLVFSQGNVTGWNGGIDATRLTIEDGGILELAYGTSNETFNGVLNLSGTLQTAKDNGNDARWDLYTNSSIVVAGSAQAQIKDVQIMLRADDRNIEVKDNATLTFSGGTITKNEGNGILVKTGNGQLIFTEDTSFAATGIKVTAGSLLYRGATLENKSITINGGVFEYYLEDEDAHTHSNSISGSGTFRKSGAGTLNISGTAGTSEARLGGITVTEGSLNLQGTTYVNAVTVGGGELTFGGTNVTHDATSLKVYGGTVNINNSSTTLGTISFGSSNGTTSGTTGGTVEFTKAEGQESATYTVGTIESVNAGGYTRNLTVGEGVTLEATNFTNDWGMGTITIDGTLIVNGEMKFATGKNADTSNNVLTGSGIVRTEKLIIDNSGNYNFSGLTLKIGSGGIIKGNNFWGNHVMLNLGALTIEATEDWSSDLNKIELVGATGAPTVFNTAGHTITMSAGGISGTGELKKAGEGTLTLSGANTYSGGTTIEAGTVTTQNASALGTGGVNMTGGELNVAEGIGLVLGGALTAAADSTLTLNNGSSLTLGAASTIAGAVTGAGNIASNYTTTFSGDVSGWTGSFTNGAAMTLTFDGSANAVNAAITQTTGNLTLTVGTTADATFGGAVTANQINVNQNTTFNGAVTAANMKVAESKTVTFAGVVEHQIGAIDTGSISGINYKVTGGASLNVQQDMWMKNSSIILEKDAVFSHDAQKLEVIGTGNVSSIKRAADESSRMLVNNTGYTISNADVNMSNSADTTLGMLLTQSSLTTKGSGLLTVSNSGNTITNLAAESGNVKLSASMDVDSISAKEDKTVTVTSGNTIDMGGGAVSIGTNGADATMTAKSDNALAQLQEDASFTIQDMTLTNTTITAATTTQVKLQNVTASNVVLAQGKFSTDADMGVTVGMGGSGSSLVFEGGLESDTITINASTGASLAVDLGDLSCVTAMGPGKYDLSITLSGVALDSYTGLSEGAGITFEGWLGELISASSDVQVSFSAVEEATPAAAAEGGAATGVTYSTGSVGTVIYITGLNVPEPATSTLSLLALAALAARRRRND